MTPVKYTLHSKASKLLAGTVTAALLFSTGGLSAYAATSTQATTAQTVESSTYSSGTTALPSAPEAGLLPAGPAGETPAAPPLDLLGPGFGGPALLGVPGGPGMGGLDSDELLATLGLSASELRTSLESGLSLSAIAKQQNVDTQKLVQLAVTAIQARLSQEYADGRITESVYNARLSEAATRAAALLNQTRPERPEPPVAGTEPSGDSAVLLPLGPGLAGMDASELAALLGVTAEQLASGLADGQSLADIAAANGTGTDKVTAAISAALTQELKDRLSKGAIWTDEYTAQLQDVQTRAAEAVQHRHQHPLPPHLQE